MTICSFPFVPGDSGRKLVRGLAPGADALILDLKDAMAHARRIVAAFGASPDAGAVGLDGAMLDRPHLKQAQAVLARHGACAGIG